MLQRKLVGEIVFKFLEVKSSWQENDIIKNYKISEMEEQAQSLVTGHVKRYTEDSNTAAELFRYFCSFHMFSFMIVTIHYLL